MCRVTLYVDNAVGTNSVNMVSGNIDLLESDDVGVVELDNDVADDGDLGLSDDSSELMAAHADAEELAGDLAAFADSAPAARASTRASAS